MGHELEMDLPRHIHLGGRKSKLAVKQTEIVKQCIEERFPSIECSVLALSTLGDQVQNRPLYSFGGKALWTRELEVLLLEKVDGYPQLDMIVHSLKDMPTTLPQEFELGCILEREDPRDAVVMKKNSKYSKLADLPEGSLVGTSALRRSAQLSKNYPHLRFESVRGNIGTRLEKLDDDNSPFACLLLASAGLLRLNLGHRISCFVDAPEMYHSVGQGALGVEIRKGNTCISTLLKELEHLPSTYCCLAERALMHFLEGGCSVPIGVKTEYDQSSCILTIKGIIVSPCGTKHVEDQTSGPAFNKSEAEEVGRQLGSLLKAQGGKKILEDINFDKLSGTPVLEQT